MLIVLGCLAVVSIGVYLGVTQPHELSPAPDDGLMAVTTMIAGLTAAM